MAPTTVPSKLSPAQIQERLAALPEWSQLTDTISRTYHFRDFVEAMRFVSRVADHAESVQHHPDLLIRWNKVTLTLSTHDAGGITTRDFDFAAIADSLAASVGPAAAS